MNISSFPKKLSDLAFDILFPISCISCGKENEFLCDSCLSKIPLKSEQSCPICEKVITPQGRTCFGCKTKSSIDGILSASFYKNELISHSVHLLKYRFIESLSAPLGKIILRSILDSELFLPDLIIPVPLHKRRLRWRGFNQAELLANYLSANIAPGFEIPVENELLVRSRNTSPQMQIKGSVLRRKNISGAFSISKTNHRRKIRSLKGKRIYLIDDITTTGSTLFECARILKKAGAKEVFGIVIARQGV